LSGESELLELPDGDFLELHWHRRGRPILALLTHGLEGSMESSYLLGLAHALSRADFDVLRWNMRGCGTERNRLTTWYHSGQSEDLLQVVSRALSVHSGDIVLVGISVGGNITLKYLGESATSLSPRIRAAVAVSVPMDLKGSAQELAKPKNAPYMQYLLRPLRARMREKAARFPGHFDISRLSSIRTFHEFDERFTAPYHGFRSVDEYWEHSSSRQFLTSITVPTLLISAQDDPFLSPGCFPREIARAKDMLLLETPRHGGHVGFIERLALERTWLDKRIVEFLRTIPSKTVALNSNVDGITSGDTSEN
jgi:predicted alpha/beta-fold hydrolase